MSTSTISGRPSDTTTLHPSEGARFLFERTSQSDDLAQAQYRAAIYTPGERFEYTVQMRIDGWFESAVQGTPAPADLASKLDTMAKLIARSAKSKQGDSLPPWPHRVMRWRGPGRG
jgi:hypothetical protein